MWFEFVSRDTNCRLSHFSCEPPEPGKKQSQVKMGLWPSDKGTAQFSSVQITKTKFQNANFENWPIDKQVQNRILLFCNFGIKGILRQKLLLYLFLSRIVPQWSYPIIHSCLRHYKHLLCYLTQKKGSNIMSKAWNWKCTWDLDWTIQVFFATRSRPNFVWQALARWARSVINCEWLWQTKSVTNIHSFEWPCQTKVWPTHTTQRHQARKP